MILRRCVLKNQKKKDVHMEFFIKTYNTSMMLAVHHKNGIFKHLDLDYN